MKTTITLLILGLTTGAAWGAPQPKAAGKHAGAGTMSCCAKCQMCKDKMKSGKGKSGMGMMAHKPGMGGTCAMPAPANQTAAITVSAQGDTYVVRGDVLYKFDADLKLVAQVRLSGPNTVLRPEAPKTDADHSKHH